MTHAQRLDADLIVAGKQGRSTLGEFLLGSVSRRILAECRCDMLIVPGRREELLSTAVAVTASG
jgi:nucleotide-binding universal stress UspA family protein